jgi:hypothetical protein
MTVACVRACLLSTCRQTRYHGDRYLLYTHLYNIGLGFSLLKKTKWKGIEEQQIYSWLLLVFVTLAKHRFSDPTIQDDSIPANWVMINNGRLHIDAILWLAFTFTRFLYTYEGLPLRKTQSKISRWMEFRTFSGCVTRSWTRPINISRLNAFSLFNASTLVPEIFFPRYLLPLNSKVY